jgi:prephenate dehydrogenase
VLRVLAGYQQALERLAAAIRDGDGEALTDRLLQARTAREELLHRS